MFCVGCSFLTQTSLGVGNRRVFLDKVCLKKQGGLLLCFSWMIFVAGNADCYFELAGLLPEPHPSPDQLRLRPSRQEKQRHIGPQRKAWRVRMPPFLRSGFFFFVVVAPFQLSAPMQKQESYTITFDPEKTLVEFKVGLYLNVMIPILESRTNGWLTSS